MLTISYAVSSLLIRYIDKIEKTRRDILLHPLSPKDEIILRYNSTISKIFYGLKISGIQVTQEDIRKTLEKQLFIDTRKKRAADELEQKILKYKKALDYLHQEWLVSSSPIEAETILTLYGYVSKSKVKIPHQRLQEIVTYLQVSSDSPFIQAAITKLIFRSLEAFSEDREIFSTLCSYLFLYKAGLDCRGALILEEAWVQNETMYLSQYKLTLSKTNITGWIEYVTKIISLQLEQTYQKMASGQIISSSKKTDRFIALNNRQKAILALLDAPNTVITNKTIQKAFNIPQITASRDLAKLTTLGFLFAHGKGRSVRYTRV